MAEETPADQSAPKASAKAGGWLVFGAFAVAAVAIVVVSVFRSPSAPSANSPSSSHVACPDNVAEYLPGGGSGAVLIGQYADDSHIVTICVIPSSGQYYYDGQVKDQPVNPNTHVSLPASQTGSGYVAVNGAYTYQITGSGLVVSKNGTVLRESKLTQLAP